MKYYLFRTDETLDFVNVNKNKELCIDTCDIDGDLREELISDSNNFVELTEEELNLIYDNLPCKLRKDGDLCDTKLRKKIRKVLE